MKHAALLLFASFLLAAACTPPRSAKGGDPRPARAPSSSTPTRTYGGNSTQAQLDYIQNFKEVAIAEMYRGGIPASIKLAQALLESASGTSDLAQNANNHFGIKCASANSWNGPTYSKKDDDRDDKGDLKESCFRSYRSVAESYADHTAFLRDPRKYNRYGFLFNLDRTDYKGWARGLQSSGYATSKEYADRLIGLIERFRLYEYDQPGAGAGVDPVPVNQPTQVGGNRPNQVGGQQPSPSRPAPDGGVVEVPQRVGRVNDVKVVLSQPGETLDDIARAYHLRTEQVVSYNDRGYTPRAVLPENTKIFIQNKKERYHGRTEMHYVREGQTMFEISQQYGIELAALLKRNGMRRGQEPAIGEAIRLKGSRRKGDAVRLRDASDPTTPAVPTAPARPGGVVPADDELFEVGPGTAGNPSTNPSTNPGGNPQPTTVPPTTSPARPATTGATYPPPDPQPNTTPGGTPQPTWPGPNQPSTGPSTTPSQNPSTTPYPGASTPEYYTVGRGDTLYSLARRFNTTVPELRRLNGISNDAIQAGQRLRVR